MGTDREARALGAGESITVNGKDYNLRPINVRALADLERSALRYYIRKYLEAWKENLDLLPGANGIELMKSKMEEASKWDLDDLPTHSTFGMAGVPVTDPLREWVQRTFDIDQDRAKDFSDLTYMVMTAMALDNKQISPVQVKSLTGKLPREAQVRYDQWWVTAVREGMIAFVFTSIGADGQGVPKNEVDDWPLHKLVEASRMVENITVASLGNG